MKYKKLLFVVVQGLTLIVLVGWILVKVRNYLVYELGLISWNVFILLALPIIIITFGYAAKRCSLEIRNFKDDK